VLGNLSLAQADDKEKHTVFGVDCMLNVCHTRAETQLPVYHHPMVDGHIPYETFVQWLETCVERLQLLSEEKHVTLVHCSAGVNRSVSVVVGHAMKHRGLTFDAAIAEIEQAKTEAYPLIPWPTLLNRCFQAHLQKWCPNDVTAT
jgi:protein-tyrosine phosphatase